MPRPPCWGSLPSSPRSCRLRAPRAWTCCRRFGLNSATSSVIPDRRHSFRSRVLLMRRQVAYACAGGLLSVGAPLGLCAVRLARQAPRRNVMSVRHAVREISGDLPDYLYVGTSTAVAFALFGFFLGNQADQLADLSETDPLTGLSNARGLRDRLEAELARLRRYREPVSLLLVDLDGLKSINDQYGHKAGDEAL